MCSFVGNQLFPFGCFYVLFFWRMQWQPIPVFLPGKSHGRRSLVGYSPWDREESDMTERLHFHFAFPCTGKGNGNPLQHSCLENPRDRGAWWAAVYGVAQSWTRLMWLSSSSMLIRLEKEMATHSSILACRIPWTEEPLGCCPRGRRVRHNWATSLSLFAFHFHALEKEMATHSSVLAWRIPGTGEPGGLPSLGSHRVGHDWSDLAATAAAAECTQSHTAGK